MWNLSGIWGYEVMRYGPVGIVDLGGSGTGIQVYVVWYVVISSNV